MHLSNSGSFSNLISYCSIMQETISNHEIANIDMSKIAALQQKRTLAFVNHFVVTTVNFLNNFAKKCEQKLMHFERKLEKINASMVLLETKLSSIPEVNSLEKKTEENDKIDTNSNEQEKDSAKSTEQNAAVVPDTANDKHESTTGSTSVKPEYERFIKMVQVGVPLDAVKLKISLEGLDPNEFDHIMQK